MMNRAQYFEAQELRQAAILMTEEMTAAMRAFLAPNTSSVIGYVGTGVGNAASALASMAGRVLTIDPPDRQRSFQRLGLSNIDVFQGDLSNGDIPLEDSRLDAIVCIGRISAVRDTTRFFSSVTRVLRKGGRFYLVEPVMSAELSIFWTLLNGLLNGECCRYRSHSEMLQAIKTVGLDVMHSRNISYRRSLSDWIDSNLVRDGIDDDNLRLALKSHLRERVTQTVRDFLPSQYRDALSLDTTDSNFWFSFHCLEVCGAKPL
jgi:SAM-dependent methyltransferase